MLNRSVKSFQWIRVFSVLCAMVSSASALAINMDDGSWEGRQIIREQQQERLRAETARREALYPQLRQQAAPEMAESLAFALNRAADFFRTHPDLQLTEFQSSFPHRENVDCSFDSSDMTAMAPEPDQCRGNGYLVQIRRVRVIQSELEQSLQTQLAHLQGKMPSSWAEEQAEYTERLASDIAQQVAQEAPRSRVVQSCVRRYPAGHEMMFCYSLTAAQIAAGATVTAAQVIEANRAAIQ
jgi:hypothetical protein